MQAEILCVGTELLLETTINTNATVISRELASIGINVYKQSVVGDNADRLKKSLIRALEENDIVITTGGLGATCDDLTKEVAAELFNLQLKTDESILKIIKNSFQKTNKKMTKNNEKQALVPEEAIVLANKNGLAPGIVIEKNQKTLILLPGPPQEMEHLLKSGVIPYLSKKSDKILMSKNINIFGKSESEIESILQNMMNSLENPTLAPYDKDGEVILRVTASAKTTQEALDKINPIIKEIKEKIGDKYIYGIDVESLQTTLVHKLKNKKLTLSTAESCTGGFLSKMITEVSGSSDVFNLGVCTYSNEMKKKVLGVTHATLEKYTAVSQQVAKEMAIGIRKLSGADIGVSTTGLAGPKSDASGKPVGLVYIGIESDFYSEVLELNLAKGFGDERDDIRHSACLHALYSLLKSIV